MAGEKARFLGKVADEAMTRALHDAEQEGALRHLHGTPLDLSDTSPDWFVHKLLKREGIAPPLVERGKDIDSALALAEHPLEQLQRRRDWLLQPGTRSTREMAQEFNAYRERLLEEYNYTITQINRAILDYNLAAPPSLHRYGIRVTRQTEERARAILPLDPASFPPDSSLSLTSKKGVRRRLWPH